MEPLALAPPQSVDPASPLQPAEHHEPAVASLRRPIGEIFVDLGLITEAQLDDALDVQRDTGERLGEILIEQGSVSRIDLAGALAAHWERDVLAAETAGAQPGASGTRRGREIDRDADLAAALMTLAAFERRLSDVETSVGEFTALRTNDALATGARLARLEQQLIASGKRKKRKKAKKNGERSERRRGDEVADASSPPAHADVDASDAGWVAFAPTKDGYRLLEVPGPAPHVGETVVVPAAEGELLVTRYGRSPIPFDGRPCAFLDRAVTSG